MEAQTNQTQDKLEKRRKGVFGPFIRQRMIIFVGDLNMPKKEQNGAQPSLLGQYLDYKDWYSRKELQYLKIEDEQSLLLWFQEVVVHLQMNLNYQNIYITQFYYSRENKSVTFLFFDTQLFCDTQIINEQMLEDLNNVLNSGDVTGIYQEKYFEDITLACRQECIKNENIYLIFNKSKEEYSLNNCNVTLGNQFTTRLRMFTSLINCCIRVWFTEWPEEANQQQMVKFQFQLKYLKFSQECREIIIKIFGRIQKIQLCYYKFRVVIIVYNNFIREQKRFKSINMTSKKYIRQIDSFQ